MGSDDEGSDGEKAEVCSAEEDEESIRTSDASDDDEEGVDEYAKALAVTRSELAKATGKKKASLLTDLDDADKEVKQKRKIDSWCDSVELKVCPCLPNTRVKGMR